MLAISGDLSDEGEVSIGPAQRIKGGRKYHHATGILQSDFSMFLEQLIVTCRGTDGYYPRPQKNQLPHRTKVGLPAIDGQFFWERFFLNLYRQTRADE